MNECIKHNFNDKLFYQYYIDIILNVIETFEQGIQ